jgi:Domain of unknown function (DUF6457)
VTRDEWIGGFAEKIGQTRPTPEEVDALLDLAAVAAHASERTAAPVACFLAGLTGRPLSELIEVAKGIEASE